ncbi:Bug family tripartite tricarboxylate transporter substrate binding protein [Chelatococcus asaccharovorans]|uniref:Tripartite-type tricarboxylate transporter receptor subunit TctC n=1 Tax=Chelatococcus asaccharovorans TaxID=28210 RepID=A0A2V3TZ01_9HYPH|nr:tripartite tricarboxylate transporter substrate binding protein [Chelatococcus asaccharovorans]MBS7707554.1 tripartite tricarboxylate transporter substrate binding protein [Chelatococcus asaccharovorans]PXW55121.1 tripartite-type tricarboxylate transporter receptor subunit TctC [Chelatococcus asaccharovorans]
MNRNRFLRVCAASVGLLALMGSASLAEDNYPSRAIRIIVPYAPGGQGDITARLISDHLASAIGQPVTVENRAGANGVIGIDALAKSAPDGYTIGVVVASHALSPALIKPLPYDPVKDFTPITTTAITQMVMVTTPALKANTVQEFIDYAKAHPGELAYKSAGPGSNSHLFGAWFADAAGIDMIHVPYKGSGDSMPDLMSGVVHMGFDTLPAVNGHIKSGQLKLLAAGGPARAPQYPDVPTVAEAGIPGFAANSWGMVLAPKGTPAPVVERLNKEIVAVLNKPDVKARLATMGAEAVADTPEAARKMLESEVKLYTDLVSKLKIDVAK